jgi:hypothetical protein
VIPDGSGSGVVPWKMSAPPSQTSISRSNWRPATRPVKSSTTFDQGPAQPGGGASVPSNVSWPTDELKAKSCITVTVQDGVGGRAIGCTAVSGSW